MNKLENTSQDVQFSSQKKKEVQFIKDNSKYTQRSPIFSWEPHL